MICICIFYVQTCFSICATISHERSQCWNGILSNYGNTEGDICISKHAARAATKNDNLGITTGSGFADGDFVLKSDITFSGLTIAKFHFNCEKVSSFFIFMFLIIS